MTQPEYTFNSGDVVLCPSHGIGTIVEVTTYEIENVKTLLYRIRFKQPAMDSLIPVHKAKSMGLRKACSKEMVNRVFDILSKSSKPGKSVWNRRIQEYETKVYSGSIILTSEVVRDLFGGVGDPNRSYSERIIYESALYRLISEIAIVKNMEQEEVEQKICAILTKAQKNTKVTVNNDDDFEDSDLESYDNNDASEDEED